jgi:DNA-binding NarL/FixJ family response regulator
MHDQSESPDAREMNPVSVVLVDDQALFREALHSLLDTHVEVRVIGEASDGEEALRVCQALGPDVVLMDLRMPGLGGAEATRRLVAAGLRCRVIVLTTFDEDALIFDALRAGAVGYLLKDVPSTRLVEAIQGAARGETFLEPAVAAKVVAEFARLSRSVPELQSTDRFSDRELEVLRCVGQGASNKEIAVALGIAEGTVKNHMTNILAKLGVDDRTRAALRAREMGLL